MRQQETAVGNKIRMPFAALATSQIERENILCLACCSSSRKGCCLISLAHGMAWTLGKPEPRTNVIPHSQNDRLRG
jgi:hypothetical protein